MREDEWRHDITIASDHPKHHDVDWVFDFYHYEYESVDWQWNTLKSSYGNFRCEYYQYNVPFPNFWTSELYNDTTCLIVFN